MTRGWVVALTALGALLASTSEADGQRPEHRRGPKAHVGIAFIAAEPVGELAAFFDQGFGAQLGVGIPIDDYGLFRIVGDLGLLVYGHERQSYCMSLPYGCRIGLDLTTTNNIAFGGLGPELALPLGVVEPYVRATRGFSYWFTNSWLMRIRRRRRLRQHYASLGRGGGLASRCGRAPTYHERIKSGLARLCCGASRERDRRLSDRGRHRGSPGREHLDLPEPR